MSQQAVQEEIFTHDLLETLKQKAKDSSLSGLFECLPNEIYHHPECPGLSKSQLCTIARSYSHLSKENSSTPALLLGSLFHDLVLMGDEFCEQTYAVERKFGRTKAELEAKAEWYGSLGNTQPVSQDIYDTARTMRDAVLGHSLASSILEGTLNEQSFFWDDPTTGELCKCRPDARRDADNLLIDLKSTTDASFVSFRKSMANYTYDIQAAFYLDGVSEVLQRKHENFVFIAVEKAPPFGVAVYHINEAAIEVGRELYKKLLKKAKEDREKNQLGYPQLIQTIDLPAWAFDLESRL